MVWNNVPEYLSGLQHMLQIAIHGMSIGTLVVMALVALFLLRSITHHPKRRDVQLVEDETTGEQGAKTKKQGKRPVRRFLRWAGINLGFAAVYPIGSRLGNRRVGVIASAFDAMTTAIDQAGHRRSQAVCLPGLIRARWIVKCDGCGQFFAFKEARSLVHGNEHSLRILSGLTIDEGVVRAQPCTAMFVEGTPVQRPVATAQSFTAPSETTRPRFKPLRQRRKTDGQTLHAFWRPARHFEVPRHTPKV